MNPMETYFQALRPLFEPCCVALDGCATFLNRVNAAERHAPTEPPSASDYHGDKAGSVRTPEADIVAAAVAEPTPVPASNVFDPFNIWSAWTAFTPAKVDRRSEAESPESMVEPAATPSEAVLASLKQEAANIRMQLAEVEARQRELVEAPQARRAQPKAQNRDHARASEPVFKAAGGISSADATKRAKKAWKTRRANAARIEEQAAARRKQRARKARAAART
jgi:hypothetical protein